MNNSGNPIDVDLIPENIKSGVDIFGVDGLFSGGVGSIINDISNDLQEPIARTPVVDSVNLRPDQLAVDEDATYIYI